MSKLLTVALRKKIFTGLTGAPVISILMVILGTIINSQSHASVGTTQIVESHPISRIGPAYCHNLFSNIETYQVVQTIFKRNGTQVDEPIQQRFVSTRKTPMAISTVNMALEIWVKDFGYSKEQAQYLKNRDAQLSPQRTIYVNLESDGKPAIVRVFDGSTEMLRGNVPWKEGSRTSYLTPIELSSSNGFILPERIWEKNNPQRPAYVWELGLLTVDPQLTKGLETAYSIIARSLDLHYNGSEFGAMGKLSSLEKKNMMIYAQTRPENVAKFARHGFRPVLIADQQGQISPFQVTTNLVLIYIKAEDFIKQHYDGKIFVHQKNEESIYQDKKYKSNKEKAKEHIQEVDRRRVQIRNIQEFEQEARKVMRYYIEARYQLGQPLLRREFAIRFIEEYLTIVNSLPSHIRHENWQNLRTLVLEALSQNNPLDGLMYLSFSFDKVAKSDQTNFEFNEEAIKKFNSVAPDLINLPFPTNPVANLKFKPY